MASSEPADSDKLKRITLKQISSLQNNINPSVQSHQKVLSNSNQNIKQTFYFVSTASNVQSTSDSAKNMQCKNCIVGELITSPFSLRSAAEKTEIVARGRCKPSLKCFKASENWYRDYPWLTCCQHLKKLYCWVCLLFSKNPTPLWCKTGVDDVYNFYKYAKRHENSRGHIDSVLSSREFQQSRIEQCKAIEGNNNENICNQSNTDNINVDEKERLNLLKKLIDTNCMDIVLQHSQRSKISKSTGKSLRGSNCKESSIFKSDDMINRFTQPLYFILYCRIKLEIESSPYFSVLIYTFTDVSQKKCYALAFRYITSSYEVKERLLKITHFSKESTENIESKLCEWLEEMNASRKLVSLTYDGGCSELHKFGTLKEIKNKYDTLFTHSYNNKLNMILQQSVSNIKGCRHFFQTIAKIRLFFCKSKRRKKAYYASMGEHFIPKTTITSLYSDLFLEDLSVNKTPFTFMLESMFSENSDWDGATQTEARGIYENYKDFQFKFFLKVFSDIQPAAERLHHSINSFLFIDYDTCSKKISALIKYLKGAVDRFDIFWKNLVKEESPQQEGPPKKKRKGAKRNVQIVESERNCEHYKQIYFNIIETVSRQVILRYSTFHQLKFVSLLNFKAFDMYVHMFPHEKLDCLLTTYKFFDKEKLQNQLIKIYNDKAFRKPSIVDLYKYLSSSSLLQNFDQALKLAALIIVLPVGKCPSSPVLSKINQYLVNSSLRLNKNSILPIEKDLLKQLWRQPNFYNTIISMSAQ